MTEERLLRLGQLARHGVPIDAACEELLNFAEKASKFIAKVAEGHMAGCANVTPSRWYGERECNCLAKEAKKLTGNAG